MRTFQVGVSGRGRRRRGGKSLRGRRDGSEDVSRSERGRGRRRKGGKCLGGRRDWSEDVSRSVRGRVRGKKVGVEKGEEME